MKCTQYSIYVNAGSRVSGHYTVVLTNDLEAGVPGTRRSPSQLLIDVAWAVGVVLSSNDALSRLKHAE